MLKAAGQHGQLARGSAAVVVPRPHASASVQPHQALAPLVPSLAVRSAVYAPHLRTGVRARASVAQPGGNNNAVSKFGGIFNVFSDERCNAKLLALSIGQMLCR